MQTGRAGANRHNFDFGFSTAASIGDTVWLDTDADGVLDIGEMGISMVDVILTFFGADGMLGGGDDTTSRMTTDSNGNYLFQNLIFGTYSVMVDTMTLPTTLRQTFDNDGTLDHTSVNNAQ